MFRGNFDEPAVCLTRNYYCAFAGVYSTYYWQGTSWYTVIYDPFENELQPKPKFIYYKYFIDFLNQIEFHKLIPSNDHSTTGICLINKENDTYVYYIPAENHSVVAQNLGEADSLEITWFNPLTGKYSEVEKRKRNKDIHIYKKYSGQDWVILLKTVK